MKIAMYICKIWMAGAMATAALACAVFAFIMFIFNAIAWFFDSNDKRKL